MTATFDFDAPDVFDKLAPGQAAVMKAHFREAFGLTAPMMDLIVGRFPVCAPQGLPVALMMIAASYCKAAGVTSEQFMGIAGCAFASIQPGDVRRTDPGAAS